MFRELRNQSKRIEQSEAERIMNSQRFGMLATASADGYPYAIPSMYVYQNGRIFLHGGKRGHKLENIFENNKVCFSVVEETASDTIPSEKTYSSVVAFGKIHIVECAQERMAALVALCEKYDMMHKVDDSAYIQTRDAVTEVLCVDIEHMTGKRL